MDAAQLIAQGCSIATEQDSQQDSLIVSGRGGLPLNPSSRLRDRAIATEWVKVPEGVSEAITVPEAITVTQHSEPISLAQPTVSPTPSLESPYLEANTWVQDEQGKIKLLARRRVAGSQGCG